jgi:hypothetical protein
MIRISSGAGKRPAREFVPAEGLHSARARGTPAASGQPRETQSRQSGANPAEPPFRERGNPFDALAGMGICTTTPFHGGNIATSHPIRSIATCG